jgi:DNA-binding transcriptional ArsR family regulator
VLKVIAEPRRREILRLIWDRELAVAAIAENVAVSTAAVSQHLARLRSAGLVTVRPDGKRRLHRADRQALAGLAPLLEQMWRDDIDRLADAAEREHGQ